MAKKIQNLPDLSHILIIGDSITARGFQPDNLGGGWVSRLQDKYVRKLDIVSRGHGGYNTRMTLELMPWIVQGRSECELVVIFLGANDSATNEKQGIPLEEYKQNLSEMLELLASDDETDRFIVITPPPPHEPDWLKHCQAKGVALDRSWKRTKEFRDACIQVCQEWSQELQDAEKQLLCLDTWALFLSKNPLEMVKNETFGVSEVKGLPDGDGLLDSPVKYDENHVQQYLVDGLHLSSLGNLLLYQGLINLINKSMPEIGHEKLELVTAPYWKMTDKECQEPKLKHLVRGWQK